MFSYRSLQQQYCLKALRIYFAVKLQTNLNGMAQPYDVFIFLAAAVITMGVLYSTHLCCACSRKKSGDAPLQGLELTSTDDSSASVSGGQQATASATEQTKLSAGGPTTHTGSGKFTLFASQCWENNSIKTRVSHFGLRLACGK